MVENSKEAGDIICSQVNTLEDLMIDSQVLENEYILNLTTQHWEDKTVGMP